MKFIKATLKLENQVGSDSRHPPPHTGPPCCLGQCRILNPQLMAVFYRQDSNHQLCNTIPLSHAGPFYVSKDFQDKDSSGLSVSTVCCKKNIWVLDNTGGFENAHRSTDQHWELEKMFLIKLPFRLWRRQEARSELRSQGKNMEIPNLNKSQ